MAADTGQRADGRFVIDADVHITKGISDEDILAHLDEPHAGHLKSGRLFPRDNWDRHQGGKTSRSYWEDAAGLYRNLNEYGVECPIVNTTNGLNKIPQKHLAVQVMRAYNNVLVEKYLDEEERLRGIITLGTQQPDKTAEEIDRLAGEDQIVGGYFSTGGPMYPLGDERYDVIYEALSDNGLPVCYHGHMGSFNTDFPRQNAAVNEFFTVHPLAHAWQQMLTMASLLANGTPEKFPDLNFVFLEIGIGLAPYMMFRYNKEYAMRRREAPLLRKPPEEYMREQFYFGTQPVEEPEDPADLRRLIEAVGVDSIMFGSDYPHWDFDAPEATHDLYQYFDEDEKDRVFSENAAEVFGISS